MIERARKGKKRGENTSCLWPKCLSFLSFPAGESHLCRKQIKAQIIREWGNTWTAILLCREREKESKIYIKCNCSF